MQNTVTCGDYSFQPVLWVSLGRHRSAGSGSVSACLWSRVECRRTSTEGAALTRHPAQHPPRNYSKHARPHLQRPARHSTRPVSRRSVPHHTDPICAFDTVFFAPDIVTSPLNI